MLHNALPSALINRLPSFFHLHSFLCCFLYVASFVPSPSASFFIFHYDSSLQAYLSFCLVLPSSFLINSSLLLSSTANIHAFHLVSLALLFIQECEDSLLITIHANLNVLEEKLSVFLLFFSDKLLLLDDFFSKHQTFRR